MDEGWVFFDGPEPEHVRSVLDVLRLVPSATTEEDAQFERELLARLDAQTAAPATDGGATPCSPRVAEEAPEPAPAALDTAKAMGVPPPPALLASTARSPGMCGQEPTPPFLTPEQVSSERALPFLGSAPGGVEIPGLSLQQYASLCAELSVSPEDTGKILVGYHVGSKAVLAALHAHWETRFTEEGEIRVAFMGMVVVFGGWLRKQKR